MLKLAVLHQTTREIIAATKCIVLNQEKSTYVKMQEFFVSEGQLFVP